MSQLPNPPGPGEPVPPAPGEPPAPESKWPLVVGIISIALGALGLLCTPLSLAMNRDGTPEQQEMVEALPEWFDTFEIVGALVGVGLAVLLVIAGIRLVMHRADARLLHLVYAVLSLVIGITMNALALAAVHGAEIQSDLKTVVLATMSCAMLIGIAYPVFLLAWFLRPSVAEEMRSWVEPDRFGTY